VYYPLWYHAHFTPFTMAPCTCTPSALVQCIFHSLQNDTRHMRTIHSGTMQFSLPSKWYRAHSHHPLWHHAPFIPFTMVPCICTPSALVPCIFYTIHNGTMQMHTIRPGTMHFSKHSQCYHAHAHH